MLVAQLFLIAGILVSLVSLTHTVSHLRDDAYRVPAAEDGPRHAQFHIQREAVGDVGHIAVMLLVAFAPVDQRTPWLWWILAATMVSYYGAYWTGHLLIGVGAPHWWARGVHLVVSACGLAALVLSYRFYQ